MSAQRDRRKDDGFADLDDLLARTPRRSPLQELSDYPFFRPEEDAPTPSRVSRYGIVLLVALACILAVELVLLVLLLH